MHSIIKLLPDSVVNQIAAGEVIQRPSSVVKELIDNAIDANSTEIKLIVKDAGKSLIQITDNGKGMSPTDARMSFDRHATSKINSADDLMKINTMGFRGEALASIASVAQVELKTKQTSDTLGTKILISDSKIKTQEPCSGPDGTQITVQHLFYNVPARKKFLKVDTVESRHIHDEFIHQALAHPEISFTYYNNDNEIYKLKAGALKGRIVDIFGKKYQDDILPLDHNTDLLTISGFIGKPELAKKSRGEQLFFVNRRFIKSPYLFHAVHNAYQDIISPDAFPFFILFIDIEPSLIDINVHPTKHEIKFEDEKLVYNFLRAAVRHCLSKFTLSPQLDFENNSNATDKIFNLPSSTQNVSNKASWLDLAKPSQNKNNSFSKDNSTPILSDNQKSSSSSLIDDLPKISDQSFQLLNTYIVTSTPSSILIIDQQSAHERIMYEYYIKLIHNKNAVSNNLLFPETIHLSGPDAILLKQLLENINALGFQIEEFGSNSFIIHASPAILQGRFSESQLVQKLIDQYNQNLEFQLGVEENIARAMATNSSIKRGQALSSEEVQAIVSQLFQCEFPYKSPAGHKIYMSVGLDQLSQNLKL